MRHILAFCLLLVIALPCHAQTFLLRPPPGPLPEKEAKQLQGKRAAVEGQFGGESLTKSALAKTTLVLAVQDGKVSGAFEFGPPLVPLDAKKDKQATTTPNSKPTYRSSSPLGATKDKQIFGGMSCILEQDTDLNPLLASRNLFTCRWGIGMKMALYPGIFELKDDSLKVCVSLRPWGSFPGFADRPPAAGFASPAGSGFAVITFKKVMGKD